jgi:hypothetical protein
MPTDVRIRVKDVLTGPPLNVKAAAYFTVNLQKNYSATHNRKKLAYCLKWASQIYQ